MSAPFLSIVIPAFNEEARITASLERVCAYLGGQSYSWEVVVVDDGSSDGTLGLLREWASDHHEVRVEGIPHAGKGWAVKHGMLAARGQYRFMCNAELALPIEQVSMFVDLMEEGNDIVIGSRQIAGARRFNEPVSRHMMGRVFNWAVRLLVLRGFQDSQCGFKCFRGEVAQELFSLQKTRGWAFDVEILYLSIVRGLTVLEVPIDWYHQRDSRIRPGVDSFLMLRDVLRVRWYDLRGRYGQKGSGVKRRDRVR